MDVAGDNPQRSRPRLPGGKVSARAEPHDRTGRKQHGHECDGNQLLIPPDTGGHQRHCRDQPRLPRGIDNGGRQPPGFRQNLDPQRDQHHDEQIPQRQPVNPTARKRELQPFTTIRTTRGPTMRRGSVLRRSSPINLGGSGEGARYGRRDKLCNGLWDRLCHGDDTGNRPGLGRKNRSTAVGRSMDPLGRTRRDAIPGGVGGRSLRDSGHGAVRGRERHTSRTVTGRARRRAPVTPATDGLRGLPCPRN